VDNSLKLVDTPLKLTYLPPKIYLGVTKNFNQNDLVVFKKKFAAEKSANQFHIQKVFMCLAT
jgi:hypothetical protein